MKTLFEIRDWAIAQHENTLHLYDHKPYAVHLKMVVDIAYQFIHLIPEDKQDVVIAACWCHDLIEDCRLSYNDVKDVCGEEIAEITYALTNEKGKTRKERANLKYYKGIRETPFADFVKACDRLANLQYSIDTKSRMAEMYRDEMADFVFHIFGSDVHKYEPLQRALLTK